MNVQSTPLPGVLLIEPRVYADSRGFFLETYNQKRYAENGLPDAFVQDNHSRSVQNTLRGLHLQLKRVQGKLVRVVEGEILDVAVDLVKTSPTYKKWFSVRLSATNFRQLYVPPGFAHGYVVVSTVAQVEYKVTDFYDPESELTILWNDPELKIDWGVANPILSAKDSRGMLIKDAESRLSINNVESAKRIDNRRSF
jgi:dTDP-4-dehydrorhamnose 3,5-epimerase